MVKWPVLASVLVTLCGCATYRTQPWTEALYANGDVYILDGTEVSKTTSLFTVHGTFEKCTFPVKREFKVYRHSDQKVIWNKVAEKVYGFGDTRYDCFPDLNA